MASVYQVHRDVEALNATIVAELEQRGADLADPGSVRRVLDEHHGEIRDSALRAARQAQLFGLIGGLGGKAAGAAIGRAARTGSKLADQALEAAAGMFTRC